MLIFNAKNLPYEGNWDMSPFGGDKAFREPVVRNSRGLKPCPTIKVASNTPMYERMSDDMDINAGEILAGDYAVLARFGPLRSNSFVLTTATVSNACAQAAVANCLLRVRPLLCVSDCKPSR